MENRTTLRWGAQEVGRLTAAPEGADTCFRAEYRLTEGHRTSVCQVVA